MNARKLCWPCNRPVDEPTQVQIANYIPDVLFQRPPQGGISGRDGCVVPGPDIQFVVVLKQERPFGCVELRSGALRFDDKLAGVLFLLLLLLLRHRALSYVPVSISRREIVVRGDIEYCTCGMLPEYKA